MNEVDLEKAHRKIIKAREAISVVCKEKSFHLTAHIPARLDDDDVVIADVIVVAANLYLEVQRLQALIKENHG